MKEGYTVCATPAGCIWRDHAVFAPHFVLES